MSPELPPPGTSPPEGQALAEVNFGGPVENVEPIHRLTTFDPEPGRERVRAAVAGALIGLLAILTCSTLIAVIAGADADAIRSITEIVLPPVVALCGSAIGFYFGAGKAT